MSSSRLSSLSSTSTDVTLPQALGKGSDQRLSQARSKTSVDQKMHRTRSKPSDNKVEEIRPEVVPSSAEAVPGSAGRGRIGGWASDLSAEKGKKIISTEEEDDRLKHDESQDDVPAIPDLDDILEEDLTAQMAAPPSVSVTRVATYNQLNTDLSRHAGLFTLDGDIDLKLLAECLTPEGDVVEEDKCWEWDKLFAELSPDIQAIWDQLAVRGEGGKSSASNMSMEVNFDIPKMDSKQLLGEQDLWQGVDGSPSTS